MMSQATTNFFLEGQSQKIVNGYTNPEHKAFLTPHMMKTIIEKKLYLVEDGWYTLIEKHYPRYPYRHDEEDTRFDKRELQYRGSNSHNVYFFRQQGSPKGVSFTLFDLYKLVTNGELY